MSKKFLFNWSLWIGLMCGVYTVIYDLTPLGAYGFLWMSFATLPVYFMGGVKTEEFPNYTVSILVAMIWGVIYLWSIGMLVKVGLPPLLASGIGVGVIVALHCAVHLIFTSSPKTYMNILPVMFSVVSLCFFSQGGQNLVASGFSVFGGVVLGLTCGIGKLFLTEEGSWTIPSKQALQGIFKTPS